jgi:MFS family permease
MFTFDTIRHYIFLWRIRVRYPLEHCGDVLHGGLLLGALVLFGVLGYSPQGRELFRLILEDPDPLNWQALFAVLATFLLSAMLFFTYRLFLPFLGIDSDYDGRIVRGVAGFGLYGIAALPWISCLFSIAAMNVQLAQAQANLNNLTADPELGATSGLSEQLANIHDHMHAISTRSWFVAIMLIVLLILSVRLFSMTIPARRARLRGLLKFLVYGTAASITLVASVYAAFSNSTFSFTWLQMGPLAAGMVTTVVVFCFGLTFSWLARICGLATSFGGVLLGAALIGVPWLIGLLPLSSRPVKASAHNYQPGLDFKEAAQGWLKSRGGEEAGGSKRLPFFVISAQGGGVYAAIESALFLARMQDSDSNFNRSVFAISSVSGGSIGASFYYAVANLEDCRQRQGARLLASGYDAHHIETAVSNLVLQPRLAAILGNVPADLLRRLLSPFTPTVDRSDALKEVLLSDCPALAAPYGAQWNPTGDQPALVLNTTWMSNGHRVAFAPFRLKAYGDGTLWSFMDVYEQGQPSYRGRLFSPMIVDAVVASARFPGILPPLSLTNGDKRHNYGDGGYADASGVLTALDMFEAMKEIAMSLEKDGGLIRRPEARLIMLTFDYEAVKPEKEDGTAFFETVAPLDAILGVRANLAQQAITRAEKLNIERGTRDEVFRVTLNPDDFGIALGFQLSRTSFEILSLLMGRAEWCRDLAYKGNNPIIKNSCVAKGLLDVIRAT